MSKDLDKFKRSWAGLKKAGQDLNQEYAAHTTNRKHHSMMLKESAREIGRAAEECKARGVTGTTLKDFLKEKEVLTVMKTVLDAQAALSKEEARLKKITAACNKHIAAIKKLDAEIAAEVKSRRKKANRKILARDSKSLPDMEKLNVEVATAAVDMKAEIIDMEAIAKWSAARERKEFETMANQEVAKSKSDKSARDTKETDAQAFDMRNFTKAVAQAQKLDAAGKQSIKQAAGALKSGDREGASDAIGTAQKVLAALKKLRAPYVREMKRMNKWDLRGMQQSKDGQAVLKGTAAMEKIEADLDGMIKKVARATV